MIEGTLGFGVCAGTYKEVPAFYLFVGLVNLGGFGIYGLGALSSGSGEPSYDTTGWLSTRVNLLMSILRMCCLERVDDAFLLRTDFFRLAFENDDECLLEDGGGGSPCEVYRWPISLALTLL